MSADDPDSQGTTLLRAEGIERRYSGAVPVAALLRTSLSIGRGERIAVVGRSGSGKSTLLNILGLLDRPTSGRYRIGGEEATTLTDRRQTELRSTFFGFVFQQAFLVPRRTALENVGLPMVAYGVSASARQRRARELLGLVGLSHREHAVPESLSGGEAQRVAIARSLAMSPQILICDEPTGNLDESTAQQIVELLHRVNQDGTTLIVATHDLSIAASFPRVLNVRDGMVRPEPRWEVGAKENEA